MTHSSSTQEIPAPGAVPRHVAIIMDGNGRWAKGRRLPRIAGHRRGVEAVRETVRACVERGVEYLTLFAFSSENWRRPADEVALLMQLFQVALASEVDKLHRNGVRLKVVGDTGRFDPAIRRLIEQGERLTAENRRLTLTVAARYGGGAHRRPAGGAVLPSIALVEARDRRGGRARRVRMGPPLPPRCLSVCSAPGWRIRYRPVDPF